VQVSVVRRAMINQPELLFADEPTGALNSKISQKVMESLKEINKKGVTIVLVTHDSKVAAYANRIVFMKDGKILTELENIKKQNQDIQNDNDIDNITRSVV
jgi:putative ABC transport system ATP-binding protein